MKNTDLENFKNPKDRLKEAVEKDIKHVIDTIHKNKKIVANFYELIHVEFDKNPDLRNLVDIKINESMNNFECLLSSIEEEIDDIINSKTYTTDELYYDEDFNHKDIGQIMPWALKNTLSVFKSLDIEFKILTEHFECFYDYEKNKIQLS